jgi:hypothetical protein
VGGVARVGVRASDSGRRWLYDDVAWGDTLCEAPRCGQSADLLFDYVNGSGVPVCCGCADRWLDRQAAFELLRAERSSSELLPELYEVEKRPAPRVDPDRYAHRTVEMWLAEQTGVDTSDPDWDIPW